MGQTSLLPEEAPALGPPRLTLDVRSWGKSGKGLEDPGDPEAGDANESPIEPIDAVLSEAA